MLFLQGCKKIKLIFMIDRALGLGSVQQQSYYFQLIPIFLSIVGKDSEMPAEGTTYRFNVSKGSQKFDQNKFPLQANFTIIDGVPFMSVASSKLNFYVPNFNRMRKQEFTLRLIQNEKNQDFEVGEYSIDVSHLVEAFKQEKKVRHQLKTFFSEDYELDFQIYVQRTRIALEKTIKEYQADRSGKSTINARAQINETKSPAKSALENKAERDEQVPSPAKVQKQQAQSSIIKQEVKSERTSKREEALETRPFQRAIVRDEVQESAVKAGKKVPLVQTKFKQLAKQDTPSEIRLKESERLSRFEFSEQAQSSSKGGQFRKQRLAMWIFLVFGVIVMYFAMHPNRKV